MEPHVEKDVSLAAHTTLRVGGVADALVRVTSVEELTAALRYAKEHTAAPPFLLGGGSNVLVSDAGYRGLVIKNEIPGCVYEARDDFVIARFGAGEVFDTVVADSTRHGYWGLENLSAIPGSVGATPVQNVGAYGVEMSDVIHAVEALHQETLEVRTFSPAACDFAYRDSYFKSPLGREWIITRVDVALRRTPHPILSYGDLTALADTPLLTPTAVRERVCEIRAQKFPDWSRVGTAGSFFKNPIISPEDCARLCAQYPELPTYPTADGQMKVSLGWILDHVCGLKGYERDGVALYERQALVLVNYAAPDAATIDRFATDIQTRVKEQTSIDIEREVRSV